MVSNNVSFSLDDLEKCESGAITEESIKNEQVERQETSISPASPDESLSLTDEKKSEEITDTSEEATSEIIHSMDIKLVNLNTWFDKYGEKLNEVNRIESNITGVKPEENLIITLPTLKRASENLNKRNLFILNNALIKRIPDIPAKEMKVYRNGYSINHEPFKLDEDNIHLCTYGFRDVTQVIWGIEVMDLIVPFDQVIVDRRHKINFFSIYTPNKQSIINSLEGELNSESLMMLYKQAVKRLDSFKINKDAVMWLLTRKEKIIDVMHLIKVDNVLMDILAIS